MARSGFQRHRGKLLGTGVVLSGLVAVGVVAAVAAKRWVRRQQQRLSEQHYVREQIKRRFTQTQQDALYTMYELVPVLALVLGKELDVEELVETLKGKKLKRAGEDDEQGSGGHVSAGEGSVSSTVARSKAELWQELKMRSAVKLLAVVYTTCMLLLLTRLQLNILARREYLETAIRVAKSEEATRRDAAGWLGAVWEYGASALGALGARPAAADAEPADQQEETRYVNEQAFLSLSWWLLNRGWLQFKPLVERQVEQQFGTLSPRDTLSMEQFSTRLSSTIHAINRELFDSDSRALLLRALLPDASQELHVLQQTLDEGSLHVIERDDTMLRELLQETSRCAESTASLIVLESLVNESFQFVMQQLEAKVTKKLRKPAADAPEAPAAEAAPQKFQVALYSVALKDCCQEMLKNGLVSMNNEFLQDLDAVPELDDLSASVYSNFGV
ncbi:AaceriADR296Cp [[Ashbya] aceris (nom. inval.)]|nr:AaceriADR296Cp [[Ashbya] aceris (nom. inval.)]